MEGDVRNQRTELSIEQVMFMPMKLRKYWDREAEVAYQAFCEDDLILPEKWINVEWIVGNMFWPIRWWIKEQGLRHVVKLHESLNIKDFHPEEIRQFYSILRIISNHPNTILSKTVHYKHVTFDSALINSLLDRNDEGVCFLTKRNLRSKYEILSISHCMDRPIECNWLAPWRQFVHRFICESLTLRWNCRNIVTTEDAFLLQSFAEGRRVNIWAQILRVWWM